MIALPQPKPVNRIAIHDIRKAQKDCNAEMQQDHDDGTGEPLLFAWEGSGDEDIGYVESDVDPDGSADHGWEDVSPVICTLGS